MSRGGGGGAGTSALDTGFCARGAGRKVVARRGGSPSARPSSRASAIQRAAPLSSGLLPLPHFGDWTQDGQPETHGQPRRSSLVVSSSPARPSNPLAARPQPPG